MGWRTQCPVSSAYLIRRPISPKENSQESTMAITLGICGSSSSGGLATTLPRGVNTQREIYPDFPTKHNSPGAPCTAQSSSLQRRCYERPLREIVAIRSEGCYGVQEPKRPAVAEPLVNCPNLKLEFTTTIEPMRKGQ